MTSTLQEMTATDDSSCIIQSLYDRPPIKSKTYFLDLPLELRAIIIRAILGDGKIHVHYLGKAHTNIHIARFSFCDREIPRENAYSPDIDIPSRSYANAHSSCYTRSRCNSRQSINGPGWICSSHREGNRESLNFERDLSLMVVSKQLREEAIMAFYTTNVFSIANSTSFTFFTQRILPGRAHLIKTLELSTTIDAMEWNKAFTDTHGELATEWNLNSYQRDKLCNVSDITIQLCDMDPNGYPPEQQHILREHRAKHMYWALRAAFATFKNLKSLSKVDVHICCEPRYVNPAQAATGQPEMDKGEMQEIGRVFAEEILRRDGKQG